jgi:predicted HTH domain antitoxin
MKTLTFTIPAEVLEGVKLPPAEVESELRKELSLALYQRGLLSLGKARLLAGVSKWDFEHLLGSRRIVRHYRDDDVEEDLAYGFSDK